LSPVWASQSMALKQKVLEVLGKTASKYPKKIENAVTIFDSYLDFTNSDADQVRLNINVLNMLAEMPSEFKTLKIALNAVDFMKYEGEEKRALHQAGLKFFRSIPSELMFKKANENNNGKSVYLEGWDKRYYQEICRYPLLTHIGEIKLGVLKRMGESEEERLAARNCLITSNLRLSFGVVKKYYRWIGMDKNRLVSEATLGLIRAAKKYDPCAKKKFSTYAIRWMRLFLSRFIKYQKEDMRLPEHIHEELNKFLNKCREANINPRDKTIAIEHISEVTGFRIERIEMLLELMGGDYVFLDASGSNSDSKNDGKSEMNNGEKIGDMAVSDEKVENIISTNKNKVVLESFFERVENRIKAKEKPNSAPRVLAIFQKRFVPKVLQTGLEQTLEEIGDVYGLSRERIRQLEFKLKNYIENEAVTPEEKIFAANLVRMGCNGSQNSFAECLEGIYKTSGFREFNMSELPFLCEKYKSNMRSIILRGLVRLSILTREKKAVYKINPIFKGRNGAETEENFAGLFKMTFEQGVSIKKKSPVFERYTYSKNKTFAIKECIQMDLAHTFLGRLTSEANIERDPCIIRVWKGYASLAQEDLPQCIRDAMKRRGSYVLKFMELDELINDTKEKKASSNEIMILPFDRLNASQKRTLETGKAWFINMDFEKQILDPDAVVQLEAIIASAIAYLNNDDFTFNNLYKILTDSTDDIKVSIEELKKNPLLAIKHMFLLNPGKVHIDDLAPLNRRMKKLIDSAS